MKKIISVVLCVLLTACIFASCGAKSANDTAAPEGAFTYSKSAADADGGKGFEYSAAEKPKEQSTDGSAAAAEKLTDEKLVKTVDISMETKEYTACVESVQAAAKRVGGYVETSEIESNGYNARSKYSRYARMVLRIPAEKLDEFLSGAEESGIIISKTENIENVTLEYVDVASRIKVCEAERDSLLEIMAKADNITDVISLRERLTEVNYEIESYTAKMRVLENKVSYSTVNIGISEVQRVAEAELSLGTEIKNRFLESWDELVEFLRSFVVGFIGGLPVLLPFGIAAAAVMIILVKIIKKRKAKKAAKAEKEKAE